MTIDCVKCLIFDVSLPCHALIFQNPNFSEFLVSMSNVRTAHIHPQPHKKEKEKEKRVFKLCEQSMSDILILHGPVS